MDYDVCLSFAGEDREYVRAVANALRSSSVKVFYDEYETADLWGRDLYQHLDSIYRNRATFCVLFISRFYAAKLWTKHELRSAQARAFGENREYILPARFDDTEIPGLPQTVGYIDLRSTPPSELANFVVEKLQAQATATSRVAVADPDVAPLDRDQKLRRVGLRRANLKRPRR